MYEAAGIEIAHMLKLPYFRIRARMRMLGYEAAKGALNFVDRKMIEPYMCGPDAWGDAAQTYHVDSKSILKMMKESEEFSLIMRSGEYIHADGHVVKNTPDFVRQVPDSREGLRLLLTDYANAHVDLCCLRFGRRYVQKDIGRYEYGRMYYDAEFIRRTDFYVHDFLNRKKIGNVNDIEAKMMFREMFPKKFSEAFQYLRVANKFTMESMAEEMTMDHNTLTRWINDPAKYRNENFLVAVALTLELPDWISGLLFKRAGFTFNEDDPRHMALQYIIRAKSCDGIGEANRFLKERGFAPVWAVPGQKTLV